jgi:hypothetical protein
MFTLLVGLLALGAAVMPKVAACKARKGSDARGAARINSSGDLPNTSSTAWEEKFMGATSTAAVMGDEPVAEDSPGQPTLESVAAGMKRPKDGGHGRGKTPRTILRRQLNETAVLEAEMVRSAEYARLEGVCKSALVDAEGIIVPEAERLGYSQIHLYVKYQALRIYYAYRAAGHSAMAASEEAGWPSLHSGSVVREWANDFRRPYEKCGNKTPKELETFSPYARGGHVVWMLDNEILEKKARKWIAKNAEKKGSANMGIEGFRTFLSGVYDPESKTFTERGLLTDVLQANKKTSICLETARVYLHRLGYSYDFTRKNVYADGFDREDVVKFRNEIFLPRMAEAERRGHFWVPMAWLEVEANWPKVDDYRAWVEAGKPDVHVDAFEWKNEKTPNGIDRFEAWGPMGGALSSKLQPGEKPVILLLQDETCIRQYDTQKKAWRHDSVAHSIAPKGEGAAIMYSGYICEQTGGFPILTVRRALHSTPPSSLPRSTTPHPIWRPPLH